MTTAVVEARATMACVGGDGIEGGVVGGQRPVAGVGIRIRVASAGTRRASKRFRHVV